MPELPEVEVIRRGVVKYFSDVTIDQVQVLDQRALVTKSSTVQRVVAEEFQAALQGCVLAAPRRRGKFLWFPLNLDDSKLCDVHTQFLMVHLGMTGQLQAALPTGHIRHERIRFIRRRPAMKTPRPQQGIAGNGRAEGNDTASPDLVFADQRLFGYVHLCSAQPLLDGAPGMAGDHVVPRCVHHIARDVLDDHLDSAAVVRQMKRKSSGIKRVLLDQQVVSGIGNIYADEALWRAKLHYARPAQSLRVAQLMNLLEHLQEIMTHSIHAGGTSFDASYVDVSGKSGYHSIYLEVYGRAGQQCRRCGSKIVREAFMNRSSHRCPRRQRAPQGRRAAAAGKPATQQAS